MKEYEVIREIPNRCSGNQKRDVSLQEVTCESPFAYVQSQFPPGKAMITEDPQAGGDTVIYADVDGLIHKYTFSEL